jgi:hypothetical protein
MKVAIQFSPQALAQVQAAHAWWKKNRPKAPRLLRDELVEALGLLRTAPGAGLHILIGSCRMCGASFSRALDIISIISSARRA